MVTRWSDKAELRSSPQFRGFMVGPMKPRMTEPKRFLAKKVRVPNRVPSSLYANKPTESTAAEPQPLCEATRQQRRVLSLVCLVE